MISRHLYLKEKRAYTFLAFFIGVILFFLVRPADQFGVRSSEIIAGSIYYPADSALQYAYMQMFSIIKYLGALIISITTSSRSASLVIGALSSGVALTALFLLFQLVIENKLLSLLVSIIVVGFEIYPAGLSYPMMFFGSGHTFGEIGSNFGLLLTGLMLHRSYKFGLIILFLLLSIHPAHGLWGLCTWTGVFLINKDFRSVCKQNIKYLFFGLLLFLVAIIIQWVTIEQSNITFHLESFDPNKWTNELAGYIKYWEHHRSPLQTFKPLSEIIAQLSTWIALVIALMFYIKKKSYNITSSFLLITFIGGLISLLTAFTPESFPLLMIRPMPMRFTNYLIIYGFILILATFTRYLSQKNTLLLITFLLSLKFKQLYTHLLLPYVENDFIALIYSLYLAIILFYIASFILKDFFPVVYKRKVLLSILMLHLLFIVFNLRTKNFRYVKYRSQINRSEKLFGQVRKNASPGHLIIAPGVPGHQYQMRTKLPILFYPGSFDNIHYSLRMVPSTERILNDLYGMTLKKDPAPDLLPRAGVPLLEKTKVEWIERSQDQWIFLSRKYKFCTVVTSAKWNINLSPLGKDSELAFWSVPNCKYDFRPK